MKNKIFTICVTWFLITIGFLGLFTFESDVVLGANTLYVGGSGGGNLSSIQEAINAANPGDTIFVYNDSSPYNENVVVNKSVNLIGENRDTTVIYGGASGARVRIEADWVNISGFTITGMGPFDWDNHGIHLISSSHVCIDDVNLSGNSYGVYGWPSDSIDSDIRIMDSIIYDSTEAGISIWGSGSCNISDNIISDGNSYGIYCEYFNNNTMSNNTFVRNKGGFYIYKADDNVFINNTILETDWDGIILENSNRNTFFNTTIPSGIWWYTAIQLYRSNNNEFYNITITDTMGHGIRLRKSSNNLFSDGVIENNNGYGIYLYDFSNENIFSDYYIANNSGNGIYINYWCTNNLIINSTISNNNYGVYIIDNCNNNLIYHNNFIDNTIQAYDECINIWNASYPTGGNYWSDYSDIDNFKGVNQDILGSDGIWDHNYSIDSDSIDYYPLVNQFYPIDNSIFLRRGWNLISIPFIQLNTDLGAVLSSISGSYNNVEWYNAFDPNDHWKLNYTTKPPNWNDLSAIDHTMGFWINITEPGGVLFKFSGVQPLINQTINIVPGWNLVGFPSLSNQTRTDALNNLVFGDEVDSIWTYDAKTQRWKEIGEFDYFELGRGYWIHSKVTKTWDVPQ